MTTMSTCDFVANLLKMLQPQLELVAQLLPLSMELISDLASIAPRARQTQHLCHRSMASLHIANSVPQLIILGRPALQRYQFADDSRQTYLRRSYVGPGATSF